MSCHPRAIVLATTAVLLGLAPAATASAAPTGFEGTLTIQPAKGSAGSHVEVRIECPTDYLLSYRPLVPVESTALAVPETGDYYPADNVHATVRPVPPGRYSVSVRCEGRGGNGLIAFSTLTATFTVVPKAAPPSTPANKPQVPWVPRGAVATGDGSFPGPAAARTWQLR